MSMQEITSSEQPQERVSIPVPKYKLYSIKAVVIATIFGTPLAGGYLISRNFSVLGNKKYALWSIVFAVLAILVSFVLGNVIPENVPPMVVSLPILFVITQLMKTLQGSALDQHLSHGGKLESCWKAFGISMIFLIVVLTLCYFAIY